MDESNGKFEKLEEKNDEESVIVPSVKNNSKIKIILAISIVVSVIIIIVVVVALVVTLTKKKNETPSVSLGEETFAQALISILDKNKNNLYENVIISPYSIRTALLMTAAGSNSETFSEFKDVLRLPSNFTNAESIVSDQNISDWNNKDKPFLSANSVWLSKDYEFYENYTNSIQKTFNSSIISCDFLSPTITHDVNSWISSQTHEKITDLVEDLSPNTVMLLINALYFKGTWESPFESALSRSGSFRRVDRSVKEAVFMHQAQKYSKYYQDNNATAAFLDFEEGVTMLLIKPNGEGEETLRSVARSHLTEEKMTELASSQNYKLLNLKIPRFTTSFSHSLKEMLEGLGLVRAFTPDAEFPFISSTPLMVSDVMHATTFALNEEGVEASAATVVEVVGTAAPGDRPIPFELDRPFLFSVLYDNVSLFMGIIRDVDAAGATGAASELA